jgi:hypothetical protein
MPMTDGLLSEKIWAKLLSGELPAGRPATTWGGPSRGTVCAACDEAIDRGMAEIEVDSVDDRQRFYHIGCYGVLDAIRQRIAREARDKQ